MPQFFLTSHKKNSKFAVDKHRDGDTPPPNNSSKKHGGYLMDDRGFGAYGESPGEFMAKVASSLADAFIKIQRAERERLELQFRETAPSRSSRKAEISTDGSLVCINHEMTRFSTDMQRVAIGMLFKASLEGRPVELAELQRATQSADARQIFRRHQWWQNRIRKTEHEGRSCLELRIDGMFLSDWLEEA